MRLTVRAKGVILRTYTNCNIFAGKGTRIEGASCRVNYRNTRDIARVRISYIAAKGNLQTTFWLCFGFLPLIRLAQGFIRREEQQLLSALL